MNKVMMIGRLTKDPEIRYTQNQTPVAAFSVAVPRRYKQEGSPESDFFNCTAWGKLAELMEKYWRKGMKAAISGRLENDTYTTKDGEKRSSVRVIVDEIEFCEKKQQSQQEAEPSDFAPSDEDLPFNF